MVRKTAPGPEKRAPAKTAERPISKATAAAFLEKAAALAGPLLEELGLELARAQCPVEGGRPVLRFFIDRVGAGEAEGDGSGVTLDDCAAFSRRLGQALDRFEEEGEDGLNLPAYALEVSSPGLDRPLLTPLDFQRFQGRRVKVKLAREGLGRSLVGRLGRAPDGGLALETAAGVEPFAFEDVKSARLWPALSHSSREAAGPHGFQKRDQETGS